MPRKPMIMGYARVSTGDQNLDGQVKALAEYGCDPIITEKASGAKMQRRELANAIGLLQSGDTFVIWRLDRLGRTLAGLIEVGKLLQDREIAFVSLSEKIETTTATGRLVFHVMGAIAEFERGVIAERTKLGMAARRAQGIKFGPGHSIADNELRRAEFLRLWNLGMLDSMTAREVIDVMNAADPKAKPIKSPQTYRIWKYQGFPGIDLPAIEDED